MSRTDSRQAGHIGGPRMSHLKLEALGVAKQRSLSGGILVLALALKCAVSIFQNLLRRRLHTDDDGDDGHDDDDDGDGSDGGSGYGGGDDDDEYDNFNGAVTEHMPLPGRIEKNTSRARDTISRDSVNRVWTRAIQ